MEDQVTKYRIGTSIENQTSEEFLDFGSASAHAKLLAIAEKVKYHIFIRDPRCYSGVTYASTVYPSDVVFREWVYPESIEHCEQNRIELEWFIYTKDSKGRNGLFSIYKFLDPWTDEDGENTHSGQYVIEGQGWCSFTGTKGAVKNFISNGMIENEE